MKETARTIASLQEVAEALEAFMTLEESTNLVAHIVNRFRSVFKFKFLVNVGFNQYLAEDFINDTIERFLVSSGRKWYKDKSFKDTFYGALDSVIENHVRKHSSMVYDTLHLEDKNEQSASVEQESGSELLGICLDFLESQNAQDDELLIFEDYILNQKKRGELAKDLGVDVKTMTNIQNRLNRKIPKLRQHLKSLGYE